MSQTATGSSASRPYGARPDRGHGVPVTGSTRFTVASVTKMVTATAALRLVERGEVRLDQPLTEVLPAEQQIAALTGAHTLHHLLSHTSGLPNYHDDEAVTWDSFLSCWDRVPCQRARRPADLLPLFRDLPAAAPPGERYSYADANYILAGLVIEAVTGQPYAEAAAEQVLTAAGMAESGFDQRDADPPRLATGYLHEPDVPFASGRANVFSGPAGPPPAAAGNPRCRCRTGPPSAVVRPHREPRSSPTAYAGPSRSRPCPPARSRHSRRNPVIDGGGQHYLELVRPLRSHSSSRCPTRRMPCESHANTPRAADMRATPPDTSTPARPDRNRPSSLRQPM